MTSRQRFNRIVDRLRAFRMRPGFYPELLKGPNISTAFRHLATRAEMAGDPDTARAARQMSRVWRLHPGKTCVH